MESIEMPFDKFKALNLLKGRSALAFGPGPDRPSRAGSGRGGRGRQAEQGTVFIPGSRRVDFGQGISYKI
jgi:hypothetical protein